MKILVTGGSGFLGLEIVKQLIAQGHQVVTLQRNRSKVLDNLKVDQVIGDLTDSISLKSLIGIEAIIHTAALAAIWGRFEKFYNINYLATKYLVDWAIENKIQYFIYTSTPSVVYEKKSLENIDETLPYPKKFLTYYAETKAKAEQYVLSKQSPIFQVLALRPHLIWGKDDPHLLPRLLKRARKNKLLQIGSGHNLVDIIHVSNAAHAHLCALSYLQESTKHGGKAYFVGQERPVPLWWFINKLLLLKGENIVVKSLSLKLAYNLGLAMEILFKLMPWLGEPPMTRFLATQLGTSHYFNQSAAMQDLAYRPILSIEDGLRTL